MFSPLCLTSDQTLVEAMKVKWTHCSLQGPSPAYPGLLQSPGHSQASLAWSLVGSLLLSPGSWCAQGFFCALQGSVSPVLCKFWWLYSGVNGDLFQKGLCRTRLLWPAMGVGLWVQQTWVWLIYKNVRKPPRKFGNFIFLFFCKIIQISHLLSHISFIFKNYIGNKQKSMMLFHQTLGIIICKYLLLHLLH